MLKCLGKFYVMFDFPGHGRSSPIPSGLLYDFVMFVQSLQHIINCR